jgi:cephalosporin hydroxylase
LYLASICQLLRAGEVLTIDVKQYTELRVHPRITYYLGSSVAEETKQYVSALAEGKKQILVILDSEHACHHVAQELEFYHQFIPVGGYLIVEDTNINGHPVRSDFGPGPMEAVNAFLATHQNFTIDPAREKFMMTQNPRGFLKRIA